jgi:hypothetical protein
MEEIPNPDRNLGVIGFCTLRLYEGNDVVEYVSTGDMGMQRSETPRTIEKARDLLARDGKTERISLAVTATSYNPRSNSLRDATMYSGPTESILKYCFG